MKERKKETKKERKKELFGVSLLGKITNTKKEKRKNKCAFTISFDCSLSHTAFNIGKVYKSFGPYENPYFMLFPVLSFFLLSFVFHSSHGFFHITPLPFFYYLTLVYFI
jgi:hypothetical protein